MNRAELKTKAKKAIQGKILTIAAIFLVAHILVAIITTITLGLAGILLTGGLMLSSAFIFLGIVDKDHTPEFGDIFYGFREKTFLNGFIGYIRQAVFTFLWSLLFFIPGIVKGISYSMMFFIMADDPKIDAGAAQKKSMKMTMGYKGDLFVLYLSFIPWFLLVTITLGIAAIYVGPYTQATLALYYEGLKKKQSK